MTPNKTTEQSIPAYDKFPILHLYLSRLKTFDTIGDKDDVAAFLQEVDKVCASALHSLPPSPVSDAVAFYNWAATWKKEQLESCRQGDDKEKFKKIAHMTTEELYAVFACAQPSPSPVGEADKKDDNDN